MVFVFNFVKLLLSGSVTATVEEMGNGGNAGSLALYASGDDSIPDKTGGKLVPNVETGEVYVVPMVLVA